MRLGFPIRKLPKLERHVIGAARVRIKGREYYLGRYGTPEAEEQYRRLCAEYVQTGRPPEPIRDEMGLSINELIEAFWKPMVADYYRKNGKPTSEVSQFKACLSLLKDHFGFTPAAEFSTKKLKLVRGVMIRPKTTGGRGWTRDTANAYTRRIKMLFAWGVEQELIPANVHHSLTTIKGLRKGRSEAKENEKVTPAPLKDVLAAMRHLSLVVRAMVMFQLRTGCRAGEACHIRPSEIIIHPDGAWEYRPKSHKTEHHNRDRRIPIGPKACRRLRPYLDRPPETYCFSPAEAEAWRLTDLHTARKTPLSCGNRPGTNRKAKPNRQPGDRYTTGSYGKAIARACQKAEVKPWTATQLRHTAATRIASRFGLEAAQTVLGHTNAKVTQIYVERDFSKARTVAADMG